MGSTQSTTEQRESTEQTESASRQWGVLGTIRHSVLLMLAVAGALLILVGYIIHVGVWAAVYAIWGGALVIVGLVGYSFVWWTRQ